MQCFCDLPVWQLRFVKLLQAVVFTSSDLPERSWQMMLFHFYWIWSNTHTFIKVFCDYVLIIFLVPFKLLFAHTNSNAVMFFVVSAVSQSHWSVFPQGLKCGLLLWLCFISFESWLLYRTRCISAPDRKSLLVSPCLTFVNSRLVSQQKQATTHLGFSGSHFLFWKCVQIDWNNKEQVLKQMFISESEICFFIQQMFVNN